MNVRSRSIPPKSSTIDTATCAATKTSSSGGVPGQAAAGVAPKIRAELRIRRRRIRGKPARTPPQRAGHGDREDAPVELDVGREWKRVGVARDERERERLRERDADRAGDGEERETFGPQLAGEAPRRCANGPADAELQAARVRLREEQVGDVGARDGQEHRDRSASSSIIGLTGPTIASCSPSRRTARSRFVSGYAAASRAAIVESSSWAAAMVGIGAQPADRRQRDRSALVQKRGGRERQRGPDVGAARGKAIGFRREHADDRAPHGADLQRAADRGRVAAEMRLPERYPSITLPASAEVVLFRQQRRPICGRMPSTGITSAVASIMVAENGGAPSVDTHGSRLDIIQAESFEARRCRLPVLRVEVIHLRRASEILDRRAEAHQPIGRGERQGTEEHALHHAEDRGARGDAQRDRQRDGDRDDRGPAAHAPRVPQIGEQAAMRVLPSRRRRGRISRD